MNCSIWVELNRFSQNSGTVSSKTVLFVMIATLEAAEVQAASSLGNEITSMWLVKQGDVEISKWGCVEGSKWGGIEVSKWGGIEGSKWGCVEVSKWGGVEVSKWGCLEVSKWEGVGALHLCCHTCKMFTENIFTNHNPKFTNTVVLFQPHISGRAKSREFNSGRW